MAYLLHYDMRFVRIENCEEGETEVECFQPKIIYATESDYDKQMAFAKAEAYNGEVTVEEVPDEETEPTNDELMDILLGVSE